MLYWLDALTDWRIVLIVASLFAGGGGMPARCGRFRLRGTFDTRYTIHARTVSAHRNLDLCSKSVVQSGSQCTTDSLPVFHPFRSQPTRRFSPAPRAILAVRAPMFPCAAAHALRLHRYGSDATRCAGHANKNETRSGNNEIVRRVYPCVGTCGACAHALQGIPGKSVGRVLILQWRWR